MDAKPLDSRQEVLEKRAELRRMIEERIIETESGTYQAFADRFNIGRSTLYELLRGRTKARGAYVLPRSETMMQLASALNKPLHAILYYLLPDAPGAEFAHNMAFASDAAQVPVLAAGFRVRDSDRPTSQRTLVIDRAFAAGRDLIAFKIFSNSMQGGPHPIWSGDIVLVDTQAELKHGMAVVVKLKTGQHVCMALFEKAGNQELRTIANHPSDGSPPVAQLGQIQEMIGKVVRIINEPRFPFYTETTTFYEPDS